MSKPRKTDEQAHSRETPGKRLEKRNKPETDPNRAKKKRERTIMAAMIILAAVMIVAAALALLYRRWVKKPDLPAPPGPLQSGAPGQSGSPLDPDPEATLNFDAVQPKVGGARRSQDIYTFLVFGADVTSGLNDTIMVGTYDITNQKATVMSIPRDTLTNSSAAGIPSKKINAAYKVYGGGERGLAGLKAEVSELVGFTPDYYVQVDWELVGEMVEAIGGVWFDIPYHMDYDDPKQDLHIHFDPGMQKLDGKQAMEVVRWRKNSSWSPYRGEGGGSDLGRLEVQHAFLKAVLKQTLQIQNVTRIGQLSELFGKRVKSDLSVENLFWFASQAVFGGLKVEDVNFCTMPILGGSYGGSTFVYPIQSQLLAIINESLNPFVERVTVRQLDLMSPAGDGSLRSSTGRLADPSLGRAPAEETPEPEESGPVESGEPIESGEPVESGAVESGEPVQSGEPGPEPEPGGDEPPEPSPAGGEEDIDWGDTPE